LLISSKNPIVDLYGVPLEGAYPEEANLIDAKVITEIETEIK